jgi:outer membrane protein TolC
VADASVATALQRRPEARRLRRQIERANRQVDLAAKDGLPRFTLGAQYVDIAATGRTPMMNGQDALALSVGVQVPLWRGKQRAQAAEARSQRRQAEASLEALRQEVETRVRDLQHRIERQRRQLALLDDTLLPKAETALEATLSAYRTGQSDFLDLLDAERTLFQLRLDRASTHARLLKTQAELDRTLGRTPLPAPASPETQ